MIITPERNNIPVRITSYYVGQQPSVSLPKTVTRRKDQRIPINYSNLVSIPLTRDDIVTENPVNLHAHTIPTILVCNIRSLAPKIDELECVTNLNNADIVCITETWLSEEIPDNYVSLADFSLFRRDRHTRGGGVAIYVNPSIQCKRLVVDDPPDFITESLWLQLRPIRLPRPISSIIIGVIYHPPQASTDDNNRLYEYIQRTVDSYLIDYPDSLICIVGDFNPNSTNISPKRIKRQCGLTQIVEILTRDTGILDWCLTNQPKIMASPEQLPKIGSSDHYCFLVKQGDLIRPIERKEVIIKRDTRDSCIRDLGQWITSLSWQEVYTKNSCQSKFENFYQLLIKAIDKYLPFKIMRVHNSDKPWITTRIKSWIKRRQKCLAQHGKYSPLFKLWRNKVQYAIKYAKKSFYNSKVKKLKESNTSKWWKEVKNLSGLADKKGQCFQNLIDGVTIDTTDKLCERINEFFLSLTSDFAPLQMENIASIAVENIPDELFVTTGEAYNSLRSLKVKKSPGPDGIPNIVLKRFAFEFAPIIADIYNASLREGYLPPLLKCAAVTPIPKKNPPNTIESDIRPISLTCQIAKVMEGFTLTRILPTILPQLDNKQFAVAGKSTEQALVYIIHLALEALDKGNCSLRLFFADFCKGFDLIDHGILFEKLSKFNIHNSLLRWIGSFLLERSQFVRIGNSTSINQISNGGIPQGTKLAPILFAVMVNDLISTWGPRIKFVDDLTAMEIVPRNSPSLMKFIVSDIQSFAWDNNMKLNPDKCKDMTVDFLQYNAIEWQPIVTDGIQIEAVLGFKLLGVYISSDLTWSMHCDYIIKKANKRLYALRKLKKSGVPNTDIVSVYCTIIRPVMEYASVVFANLPQILSNDLERVQRRALEIIYPSQSYAEALSLAGIQPLSVRRDAACKKFVGNIKPDNPLYPFIHQQSPNSNHTYSLRSERIDRPIRTRTDRFENFVTVKFGETCLN